jgi:hypothetical protein
MLIRAAATGELFHTPVGTAFADLIIDGHRQTWPVRSKRFRAWLRRRHYQETGEALSAASITSVLDLLEARAQFDGCGRWTCASPSTPAVSILTSPTRIGAPWKLTPPGGA